MIHMDTPDRGARMLVYLVVIALIGFGVIDLSLHWAERLAHHASMQAFDLVLPSVCFVLGIVVLIKINSISEWISNRFDE